MSDLQQYISTDKIALNTDDSDLYKPLGSSEYNLNILVGEDGLQGCITNAKGNLKVPYSEPMAKSNVYQTMGSFYNHLTRKAYFIVFGQPYLDIYTDPSPYTYKYDNRVLCFNEDTHKIDTIFYDQHNYLGLDPKYLLTGMRMIETWLFYNPISSQPRMIDVDMAWNYTNYPAWDDTDPSASASYGDTYTWKGGVFVANTSVAAGEDPSTSNTKWDRIGSCYSDDSTVDGSDFYRAFLAIKTPPLDRIAFDYGSDPSVSSNNVQGKVFRFCHRYQYFDNSYSVCSAHSNLTRPVDDEVYNGEKSQSGTTDNYITLSFSLYSPALVKNIEIFFQEIGGDWKRATIINRQAQTLLDDVDYTYDFYNNESYPTAPYITDSSTPPISTPVMDIVYDAVPRKAASQEIINKNILCYAGCTEGFNNIDKDLIDITLTPVIKEIPTDASNVSTVRRNNITSGDLTWAWVPLNQGVAGVQKMYFIYIDVSAWFAAAAAQAGDIYRVTILGLTYYNTLGAGDVDTAAHLASAMASSMCVLGYNAYVTNTDTVTLCSPYVLPWVSKSEIYDTATVTALAKTTGFKTSAYHPFCLFYYDEALRRGDPQVVSDMAVYVPSVNEYSPPVTGTNYRWNINWSVNHEPPTWARYWKWGYAGNRRCGNFVQYIVKAIADGDSVVNNSVEIDITPLQTLKTTTTSGWNAYPNSVIAPYEFAAGDRIRFMTELTDPATPGTLLGDAVDGIYDFEILKQDAENHKIYVKNFDFSTPKFGVNSLVEIYTPKANTDTEVYYEFGDMYPIIIDANGNNVHKGVTQDQVIGSGSQAAEGTFSTGDVYHIMRTPSKPLSDDSGERTNAAFHESMWWSDFYESDDWDRGKIGVESAIGEVQLNIIRFSDSYLQNTAVNGITTFSADNFKELNDTYGNIVSIVEVGDTLKCYQEKKASSIQIGRTSYYNADGESTNVQTQSFILGTIRYSNNNFGTTFPESISKNNRYVYGFDAYSGVVWRDSPAGIFPISGRYADIGGSVDYKMQTYFKDKAKALLTSGISHCRVFTVWDEEYKMLYVSFKDTVNEENNETVVFHEPSDKWITFTEFEYTPSGGWNELLELEYSVVRGFENGIDYSFDEDTRFAVFNIGKGLGTTANVSAFAPQIGLKYTILAATASVLETPRTEAATSILATSFVANWSITVGATGFYLDVATDSGFTSKVAGFDNLSVGNVRTYAVTGLDGRSNYYYRVRAIDSYGDTSANSDTRTVAVTLAIPFATDPTNPTVSSFSANWNSVTTATGYRLDVALDSAFTSFVTGFNNLDVSNVTTYSVTGLTEGVLYWYRVRAYNTFQTSASSNIKWQTTLAPPSVPVATAATEITSNTFRVNWLSSQGATYYQVEVASDSGFTAYLLNTTTNPGVMSYVVYLGLAPQTNYYYRISAYNDSDIKSAASNVITVKTLMGNPTALGATNNYSRGFRANWYVIPGTTAYYIDVATDSSFTTLAKDDVNAGSGSYYDVTGLTANTIYYYRIRATDGVQTTGNSNVITQCTAAAPSVPSAQAATDILNNGFTANWYASTNATGYNIDVATDSAFTSKVAGFDNADVSGLSVQVTSLSSSTAYYYRVRSHDAYGVNSAYSSTITVYTLAPAVPNPPVATDATSITTTGFTANWGASDGATGYKIYVSRYFNFSGEYIIEGLDVGNVTSYAVTDLTPALGYYYRVCAYSAGGTGSPSNTIGVTTASLPLPTITITPTTWNFGGKFINKVVTVSTTNATTWGVNFPSLNARIHQYSQNATSITLYYDGEYNTGDSVTFYATGAGGTTTTTFTGRWT